MQLANVVQKGAGQQQVAVYLRIIARGQVADREQRYHVIEQAADKSVVQRLGSGRILVRRYQCFVRNELVEQRLEPGVLETVNVIAEGLPELVDVLGRLREVVRIIDLRLAQLADLVDGHLPAAVVLVQDAFDLDEIVLVKAGDGVADVVPHVGLQLSGAVRKHEGEIEFTVLLRLHLFDGDDEVGGDGLVFQTRAIADIEILHPDLWGRIEVPRCKLRAYGIALGTSTPIEQMAGRRSGYQARRFPAFSSSFPCWGWNYRCSPWCRWAGSRSGWRQYQGSQA